MRVLMVTPNFYPIEGGTETMVRNLSIELNGSGVHTDVMTFNMDEKWKPKWRTKIVKIDGVPVFKIPAVNWLPIAHSPRITFRLNLIPGRFTHLMNNYDVIHFHEAEFSFPFFSRFVQKPKILHLHGIRYDYFKRFHFSRYLLKTAADVYISLTKIMKKELIELGIPKEKIALLPNAVDTQHFYPKEKTSENKLLYVGRIDPIKGIHVLLEALEYIKKPVELEIIGPPSWDRGYYKNVLQLIEKENQRGKHTIKYLGRLDPCHPKLIESYQKASICVLPSFYEAFGVVLLEAMACETPVVSTYAGGNPEVVIDGETGLLVPVNNVVKLADAINYMLENPDVRKKFGKRGRKLVEEKFSIEAVVSKLRRIYKRTANV